MQSSIPLVNLFDYNENQPPIFEWAKSHYRSNIFSKDESIPTRSGLLYFVERGTIRLTGKAEINESLSQQSSYSPSVLSEEVFLGFVGKGKPFEVISQFPITVKAIAHVDLTSVIWLSWNDLDPWPEFKQNVFETFRYQHQRKLLWLSMLGQKRTIDRLLGFLNLLIEEYGQPTPEGYYLPYILTHAQIASAIGTTRVTITRLMGRLRKEGLISLDDDHLIYLPVEKSKI